MMLTLATTLAAGGLLVALGGGIGFWSGQNRSRQHRLNDLAAEKAESQRVQEALARTADMLERTEQLSQVGGWELDVPTGQLLMSREAYRINDVEPSPNPNMTSGFDLYAPEVRPVIVAAITGAMNHGTPFDLELPKTTATGRAIWVRTQCNPVMVDGRTVKLRGTFQDITQRKHTEIALQQSEERLRATLDAVPDLLFEIGLDGTYYDVHSPRTDLLAAPAEVLLGKRVSDVMPGPAAAAALAAVHEAHETGYSSGRQMALSLPQGDKWFELSVSRKSAAGSVEPRFIVLSRDVTSRKLGEAALQEAALHTQTILDNMLDGVITISAKGLVESFNQAASNLFGYASHEVLGRNLSMLMPEPYRSHHDSYLKRGKNQNGQDVLRLQREVDGLRKDGRVFPMSLAVSRMERAGVATYIGIVRDISQHRHDIEEIRRLAFFDPLTGLPNRRLLMDRLQQAMVTSARSNQHGSLMFLDLDHFKQLNDTLGHDVGDVLLQQVAARLHACLREGDSVARLGGDEFVVLLENLSTQAHEAATQAETVANKIRDAFGRPFDPKGHAYDSTPSVGIVMFLGDVEAMDDLIKKADVAMYQAKSAGRNTHRFYDPETQAVVAAHDALEKDMRRGLSLREFALHYQIQVDGDGTTTGVEALVRWNNPRQGLISPARFIPLAEETGLILPLGQWVLETACAQLTDWATQPDKAHWTMAVNVSASQFAQSTFVASVADALCKSGANPQLLKLELTESTLVADVEGVIVKMNAIKAVGVSFSLDDFGTGYSSLSYLKRLPLDQLKIDQSFVRDVLIDPSDAVIARTILALGHSLGLKVIAEGVETREQRNFLADNGCDAFQGYYFGRPVLANALETR